MSDHSYERNVHEILAMIPVDYFICHFENENSDSIPDRMPAGSYFAG